MNYKHVNTQYVEYFQKHLNSDYIVSQFWLTSVTAILLVLLEIFTSLSKNYIYQIVFDQTTYLIL